MNRQPVIFNLASAQAAAQIDRLEDWVHAYLNMPPWANLPFSEGLRRQERVWLGPLPIALDQLQRCCGPEPDMPFRVDTLAWEHKISALVASITDVAQIPPLIVCYQPHVLIINDGNHRYAAMCRKGWTHGWMILWFVSREAFEASHMYAHA